VDALTYSGRYLEIAKCVQSVSKAGETPMDRCESGRIGVTAKAFQGGTPPPVSQ